MGRSSAKSHSSLWKCTPKKYSRQTAFGFWSILCKKSRQRPEMYPEKTFRPDNLRLPFPTDREAPQVARCDSSKKSSSRQPLTFGQSPAKSPVSLRRYTPEKCLRPSASGCLFPPIARLPKRPATIPRKSTAPDGFQLLVNPFRKISPETRCDNSKKSSSRKPSTFDQSFSKNLSSDPLR